MTKIFMMCISLIFCTSIFGETLTLTSTNSTAIINPISIMTVSKAQHKLSKLCRDAGDGADLYLVLYSPGGSVGAGRHFIDFVKALSCKVHTVTLFAASMAYQIVQALGTRYATSSGVLMSHRAFIGGLSGRIPGELETRLSYYKTFISEVEKNAAERIGIPIEKYNKAIHDELWLTATNGVKLNHLDKTVDVVCDDSLSGYKTKSLYIRGVHIAEYKVSNCPLTLGPIEVDATNKSEDNIELTTFLDNMMNFFTPHKIDYEKYKY